MTHSTFIRVAPLILQICSTSEAPPNHDTAMKVAALRKAKYLAYTSYLIIFVSWPQPKIGLVYSSTGPVYPILLSK